MTLRTLKLALIGILALGGLTACGESKAQLAAAHSYSCTDLAREIGKREQRKTSAQVDGFANSMVSIFSSDKEVRTAADVETGVNLIDEIDAGKSLKQLQKIYDAKGCA